LHLAVKVHPPNDFLFPRPRSQQGHDLRSGHSRLNTPIRVLGVSIGDVKPSEVFVGEAKRIKACLWQ